jgi:protein-tyrosine phosphatase
MSALIDTHVHLFAGVDDGPKELTDVVAMARYLVDEGVSIAVGVAHQNPYYWLNTADALRESFQDSIAVLAREKIPLAIKPAGEIMLIPELEAELGEGTLLTVGNLNQFLLVEMPPTGFVDVLPLAAACQKIGMRLLIAHAERYEPLLYDDELGEKWIAAGCVMQFTANEFAEPHSKRELDAIKKWVQRGMVHMLCSDGHNVDWRPPKIREGYNMLKKWTGASEAHRIGYEWPSLMLEGRPITLPPPKPPERKWFGKLFGG